LEVRDGAGQTFTTNGTLPVEQVTVRKKRVERIADKQIDRYSLIIFDFDKGDLNETNRKIAQFIKARIRPTAAVTIEGSTDRIGEAEYNKRLSEERARSTARALGVAGGTVRGIGESGLYDNDLPEGRFYCRTVSIVVETPVVE
ncbi:MAG: OmpA family protein, partial [Bacteroidota bacterium]